MLFQNSFVSFVAAIALAISVSASAIAARGVVPTCPAGLSPYCCDSEPSFTGLPTDVQNSLKGAAPSLDQGKPVGQNCAAPPAQGCPVGGKPLCCPILQNVVGHQTTFPMALTAKIRTRTTDTRSKWQRESQKETENERVERVAEYFQVVGVGVRWS
ncbi:hypothetical protein V8E53_005729 [Lactarius tabidus]